MISAMELFLKYLLADHTASDINIIVDNAAVGKSYITMQQLPMTLPSKEGYYQDGRGKTPRNIIPVSVRDIHIEMRWRAIRSSCLDQNSFTAAWSTSMESVVNAVAIEQESKTTREARWSSSPTSEEYILLSQFDMSDGSSKVKDSKLLFPELPKRSASYPNLPSMTNTTRDVSCHDSMHGSEVKPYHHSSPKNDAASRMDILDNNSRAIESSSTTDTRWLS
jgi:hypothetical protein